MKKIMLLGICFIYLYTAIAQNEPSKKNGTQKVVDGAGKVNNKAKEISDASDQVAEHARQTGESINNTINNAKAIIKVFEPILEHFKKNKKNVLAQSGEIKSSGTDNNCSRTQQVNSSEQENTASSNREEPARQNTNQETSAGNPGNYGNQPENGYNADGTMNIGHQNNGLYGNCIDLLAARVVGMGEAEESPGNIDLIFFSQFGGLGYSFESPAEAPTINEGTSVKTWRQRNETEIAETKLSIAQFDKITANSQLLNAVKNTPGFKGEFYTPNKMDGRVFAVKITQDDRELYALLAVYKQYGTSGSNGYLKIKIKVQGVDANRDGYPDPGAYQRQ